MNCNVIQLSQVETIKAIINRYFEAYNTKNAIFDEIITPAYMVSLLIWARLEEELLERRMTLKIH